jgi:hypothetical protein
MQVVSLSCVFECLCLKSTRVRSNISPLWTLQDKDIAPQMKWKDPRTSLVETSAPNFAICLGRSLEAPATILPQLDRFRQSEPADT